jgi:hypothetical protein
VKARWAKKPLHFDPVSKARAPHDVEDPGLLEREVPKVDLLARGNQARSRLVEGVVPGGGAARRVRAEPLDETEAVELEHPLGSSSDRVEMKLVDLGSGENSVLVKLDEDLVVPLGQSVRVAGDR